MSRDWQKEAMKLEDERSKVLAELRDQVSQLLQQYAAEKERADIAEAKSDYWERNYYALQREYNEYRTIYPLPEREGDAK
ncbi:hypothetical protein D3C73_387900 [compost metagenome]